MARGQIRPARALTPGLTQELVDRLAMSRNTDKRHIDRISNNPDDRRPGAASTAAAGPGKRRRLVWLTLFLVLAAGAGLVCRKQTAPWPAAEHMGRQAMAICTAAVPEAAAAVPQVSLLAPEPVPIVRYRIPEQVSEPPPPTMKELYLVQVGDQLRVAAAFSRLPGYRLFRQDRGRRLVLELPAETTLPSLADEAMPTLLEKLTRESFGGRVQLVFSFDRAFSYDELELRDDPDGEGRALLFSVRPEPAVAVSTAAPASPKSAKTSAPDPKVPANAGQVPAPATEPAAKTRTFSRQAARTTDRQRAENLYREAMAAFQKGHPGKAERALRAALVLHPGHVAARDALLRLSSQLNRPRQVADLLAQGAIHAPDHLSYRIRFVRLLIDKGELSRARKELTRAPLPSVAESTDLHAMSATVSLRQGRYGQAAETYRKLLEVQPGKAVWWMGLGIALEGDADRDKARQAYNQALHHDGLSDNLQTFIRRRLAASGDGRPGQSLAGRNPDEDRS